MKTMFKIFLLVEMSVKDQSDDFNYSTVVKTEMINSYDTYEEAVEQIREYLEKDPSKIYQVDKIFTTDTNSNNSWLF